MKRKSISLIQMIAVLTIMGLLLAIVLPNTKFIIDDSKMTAKDISTMSVQLVVDMYKANHKQFPTVEQPTLGNPSRIDWTKLEGRYLHQLPEGYDKLYWYVDVFGVIWVSDIVN